MAKMGSSWCVASNLPIEPQAGAKFKPYGLSVEIESNEPGQLQPRSRPKLDIPQVFETLRSYMAWQQELNVISSSAWVILV
ncbi:hypothetical protein G3M48_001819, partial [Beauveria asiatica]